MPNLSIRPFALQAKLAIPSDFGRDLLDFLWAKRRKSLNGAPFGRQAPYTNAHFLVPIDDNDMSASRTAFVSDRQADALGRQEMIRSERTREKSRSCVTSAAALIAKAPAA